MDLLPAPPLPPLLAQDGIDVQAQMILVNRYRKARKCANVLLSNGANATQAAALGTTLIGRTLTANAAATHIPSETTWALIVELVREVRA